MKAKAGRTHTEIPWVAIFRTAMMRKSNGEPRYSIKEMAQKFGYWNKDSKDSAQEFRGILSRARTIGIPVDSVPQLGKIKDVVKKNARYFLPSTTVHRGAGNPKAPKPQAKTPKAAKPQAKTATAPKVVTANKGELHPSGGLFMEATGSGKMLRIRAGKGEVLVSIGKVMPQLVNLLDSIGFEVKEKPAPEATAETAPEATTETAPQATENKADVPQVEVATESTATSSDTQAA